MLWEVAQGSVRVLAIEDGGHCVTPEVLFPTCTPEAFTDEIWVSFGCFLVENAEGLALIDVGFGRDRPVRKGVSAGQLFDVLEVLDIDPTDITTIVHTHVHPDHVGGHILDGEVAFPNADVFVHEDDLIYDPWSKFPVPDVIRASLRPLKERNQLHAVSTLSTLPMRLGIIETHGHTPGHISVEIVGDEGPIIIAGDVSHHPMQLRHPTWHAQADMNIAEANEARRQLFKRAATRDAILACGHYEKPGFGRVVSDDTGWRFVPAG